MVIGLAVSFPFLEPTVSRSNVRLHADDRPGYPLFLLSPETPRSRACLCPGAFGSGCRPELSSHGAPRNCSYLSRLRWGSGIGIPCYRNVAHDSRGVGQGAGS